MEKKTTIYRMDGSEKDVIVITVPHLPDSSLGPNARLHYATRYGKLRDSRDEMIAIIREKGFRQEPLWEAARLSILFCATDRRIRDLDNLIGCCKGWIDALVGEIIVDDNARRLELKVSYKIGDREKTSFAIRPVPYDEHEFLRTPPVLQCQRLECSRKFMSDIKTKRYCSERCRRSEEKARNRMKSV